jgi:hypothetical protein
LGSDNDSELAGATFTRNGTVLFFNVQDPGTLRGDRTVTPRRSVKSMTEVKIQRRKVRGRAVLLAALIVALAPTAASAEPEPANRSTAGFIFALIGDTPYGPEQVTQFADLRAAINADSMVRMVLHAGDVKGGSERCDDALFAQRHALYEGFEDPFVLTPGDNEWTDCHRTAAGSYLPTERLAAMRAVFTPCPGTPPAGGRCGYAARRRIPGTGPTSRTSGSTATG